MSQEDKATAAIEKLATAKENYSTAREELKEVMKENKIKRGAEVEDVTPAKVQKSYKIKLGKVEKAKALLEKAKEAVKSTKVKKERVSKYEYPEDCLSVEDKKKYRTKLRNAKKKADKPAKEKKADKGDAPAKGSKKKTSKKKVEAEDANEDED